MTPLAARVVELLQALVELPEPELAPDIWYSKYQRHALELTSLEVVQLVDLIEASFELLLTSDDVVRAHFATPAALVRRLEQRGLA